VKLPHNWKWKFIFQSASDTIALTFFSGFRFAGDVRSRSSLKNPWLVATTLFSKRGADRWKKPRTHEVATGQYASGQIKTPWGRRGVHRSPGCVD
jgi:hypothetical protein